MIYSSKIKLINYKLYIYFDFNRNRNYELQGYAKTNSTNMKNTLD